MLSTINFCKTKIDDDCVEFLGDYIEECPTLEVLNLKYTMISDRAVKILSGYLTRNSTLKELNLWGNKEITEKSTPHIILVAKRSAITHMNLIGTSISYQVQQEVNRLLNIPFDQREAPIQSDSKSAAKKSPTIWI